jgi:hypothetical protein
MESSTGTDTSTPLVISKSDRDQLAKDIAKEYVKAKMQQFKPTTDPQLIQIIIKSKDTVENFDEDRKKGIENAAKEDGIILGDAISEVICDFLEKHCASATSTTI